MRLFRITSPLYASDLSGTGSRLFGGRWTPKGVPAVYLSDSAALATLEFLVNLRFDTATMPLALTEVELPDDLKIETTDKKRLDRNWNAYPHHETSIKLGGDWAMRNDTAALRVPSAVLPYGRGWNYILNPANPEFGAVKVIGMEEFTFDRRVQK